MTLREEFEKETCENSVIQLNVDGIVNEVFSDQYVKWLEHQLTWRKFEGKIDYFPCITLWENGDVMFFKHVGDWRCKINPYDYGYKPIKYLPITLPEEE